MKIKVINVWKEDGKTIALPFAIVWHKELPFYVAHYSTLMIFIFFIEIDIDFERK